MKGMNKIRVLDPRPERPFLGFSLLKLEQAIRSIQEPSWHKNCANVFVPRFNFSSTYASVDAPVASSFSFRISSTTHTTSVVTPAASGGLFGSSSETAVKPICSISAKIQPIIDGQLSKIDGLDLKHFVNYDRN